MCAYGVCIQCDVWRVVYYCMYLLHPPLFFLFGTTHDHKIHMTPSKLDNTVADSKDNTPTSRDNHSQFLNCYNWGGGVREQACQCNDYNYL